MKRNKLVLSSGILYVISSALMLIFSLVEGGLYFAGYDYIEFGYTEVTHEIYLFVMLIVIFSVLLALAKAITLLIFGIKIIKRSKTFYKGENKVVVAGMIIGYVFAFFDLGSFENYIVFSLILTGAIMLSVALSKLSNEKAKKFNVNSENSPTSETTHIYDINAQNSDKQLDESTMDRLKNQVQSLQSLKEQNLISEEEYLTMLKKLIDSSVDKR